MPTIRFIKKHPVLSYCALVLLWSFSWWSLILTLIPAGTIFDPPLNPAVIDFMLLGATGPSLAGIVLTRLVGSQGSARVSGGRTMR